MPDQSLNIPTSLFDGIELVSTDVFDTLLLRTHRSERARIIEGERQFARVLAEQGLMVEEECLIETRIAVQKWAYRALNLSQSDGEVALRDVILRQLAILGLPRSLSETRLAIEMEVERRSLRPNKHLADLLGRCRNRGRRVVAVSDTGLPTAELAALLAHFQLRDMVDRVYSSAEMGLTKRRGDLFGAVLALEGVAPGATLHIGDDRLADHDVPSILGLRTFHLPRAAARRRLSRLHGGVSEVARLARRPPAPRHARPVEAPSAFDFGRDALGPIVAEFALAIWLYADEAGKNGDAVMLFCARGGLAIREAFERVLRALQLPLAMPRENLMVSRLIAARAAVMTGSGAALDELGREFSDSAFRDVASALGGGHFDLPASWDEPFRPDRFFALLGSASGAAVKADIGLQNDLFRRHLAAVGGGAKRLILCDTGLYGSTQRLLSAGLPDQSLETLQFARSNYKRLSEDHFPRVVGLTVERNGYSPFVVRSTVLRYWQLIESLFEPAIASARLFSEGSAGEIICNSGNIAFGTTDVAAGNPLLAGAFAYIDSVSDGRTIMADAALAWPRLKRAITRPDRADLEALSIGERSVDFGRVGTVRDDVPAAGEPLARLASLKSQLWREGAVVRSFPRLRLPLLMALETFHSVRGVSSDLRR